MFEGIMGKAKEKNIKDVAIGSFWKHERDDSIWRVSYKDDRIHIISLAGSNVKIYGVNIFFATFSLVEYGAICISCKKEFPYTEKKFGFKCWGCKNGV